MDPEKINAILQIKPATCVKEIRSFLGMASWYRRLIADFAPLTDLLKIKIESLFGLKVGSLPLKKIKNLLVAAPILSSPCFELPFIVQTDASGFGLCVVLTQQHADGEKVI